MSRSALSRFAGVVAFLVLGAGAACGGGSFSDGGASPGTGASGGAASRGAGADVGAPGSSDTASERKVVINSALTIEVEKLATAYNAVSRIARSAGGFVAESNVSGEGERGSAMLRLRVPASLHDEVVADVRALGLRVLRESTNSKEVTEEYTDLQARVRNLERTEAQYQTILAQARNLDEVFNVNTRLETVRGQIEQSLGRIRLLDSLTDFATITVSMALPAPPAPTTGRTTPAEVFASAWQGATELGLLFASLLAVTLVAVIWLVPLTAIGLVSLRVGRRLAPVARRIVGP